MFIKNYADVHAMPLPGRLPKHNDFRVMLLPSDVTKRKVYDEYVVASQEIQDATSSYLWVPRILLLVV